MNRLILLMSVLLPFGVGAATTTITDAPSGISWTFNGTLTTGQFANGDWWVVGPATLTAISPATSGGMSGSMTNPVVVDNSAGQGFDSRMINNGYVAGLNFATFLPSLVGVGTSILSAKSYSALAAGNDPQLQAIAVLTVLAAPASSGDFRPPYVGTDKTLHWNTNQFDYSTLGSLAPTAHTPSLSSVVTLFSRPRIEINTGWTGAYWHPADNYPWYPSGAGVGTYGREIANTASMGLLMLQLNFTAVQKAPLLTGMVQYGIDVYGAQINGGYWGDGGGHNVGRKMSMMLAGKVLHDAAILTACANSTVHSEDQQTFYVAQADINLDHSPHPNYTQSNLGLAEWGANHQDQPIGDDNSWGGGNYGGGANYRNVAGPCQFGSVLCAYIMGVTATWNHQAYFDYFDRAWSISGANQSAWGTSQSWVNYFLPNGLNLFEAEMWVAYRNATPPVTPPCPQPTITLSPAASSLNPITATLSDSVGGARIYYTLDGSTPTTSSTLYAGPINVTSTLTVNAIATATGYTQSPMSSSRVEVNDFSESGQWHNEPITPILTNECLTFNVTVSTNNINGLISLTQTNFAQTFTDLAGIIRFNDTTSSVDARNGGVYAAVNAFTYTSNIVYSISNYFDVAGGKYSVYASSNNTTWTTIALNYAYRTETQPVTGLSNLALYVVVTTSPLGTQTMRAYNFRFFNSTNTVNPDPVFDVQPTNATVLAIGGSTNITVHANNVVSYQWYLGGLVIPGATSNVLTIVNAQCSNSGGMYYCTATSAQGFIVQSATVSLTVIGCDPSFVVQPVNVILSPPSTAMFNVTVAGTAPLGGQWYSNAVLIAGATGFSYTTPPTTIKNNGDLYYFIATSGVGSKQSSTAQIQMGVAKVTNFAVKNAFINPH